MSAQQAQQLLADAWMQSPRTDGTLRLLRRLAFAGCEVRTYQGRELSLKAEGGATCLTRPCRPTPPWMRDWAGGSPGRWSCPSA